MSRILAIPQCLCYSSLLALLLAAGGSGQTTQPASRPTTAPALKGLTEGIYLTEIGRLSKTSDGQGMQLIFERDGKATAVPILPNLELMRMENAMSTDHADLRFRVSGQITVYKDLNYLLIEKAERVDAEQPVSTTQPATTKGVR